jgi:O-antigen/teichoic acid export membrane protein
MKRLYFAVTKNFFEKELIDEDNTMFYRGIKKSILVQAFSYFFVFISSLLFVKAGGVENYGIYVNIFNWISVLTIIGCFGMEDVVLVEIPVYIHKNKTRSIINLVYKANKVIFIASVLISIIFAIIVWFGTVKGFSGNRQLFLMALVNVYLASFITVNQQTLQAFNRFYVSQVTDKILRPFLLIIILCAFWFAGKNIDARLLIFCNTAVLAICAVIVLVFLKNTLGKLPQDKTDHPVKYKTLQQNGYFLLISLLFLLKSKISMLILGSFNEAISVGILNIAYRLSDIVLLPYLLIHSVVPQLFSSHIDSDVTYKRKLFQKSTRLTTIGALFIMLFFIFFGKTVLQFYNSGFGQYFNILLILCGSQFLYSLFGPSSALLMMQGRQKEAAFALVLDIVFNCLLFFLFINWFGLVGAAMASFCGSLFYNIILRIMVQRHLSEKPINS